MGIRLQLASLRVAVAVPVPSSLFHIPGRLAKNGERPRVEECCSMCSAVAMVCRGGGQVQLVNCSKSTEYCGTMQLGRRAGRGFWALGIGKSRASVRDTERMSKGVPERVRAIMLRCVATRGGCRLATRGKRWFALTESTRGTVAHNS